MGTALKGGAGRRSLTGRRRWSAFASSLAAHKPNTMPRFQAAVLHGIDDLRLQEWELPSAPPALALSYVEPHLSNCRPQQRPRQPPRLPAAPHCNRQARRPMAMCGCAGGFIVDAPMVIGHESEVAAVGAGVAALQPGDRVALEPGVPCCASRHFREGRYNLAQPWRFFATPPVHGSLAEVRGGSGWAGQDGRRPVVMDGSCPKRCLHVHVKATPCLTLPTTGPAVCGPPRRVVLPAPRRLELF